ncbi:Retrotransposon gag domain [Sesbania bispinosa]|nr:Retrotransposon gag domain [Sesbania bispinosa]
MVHTRMEARLDNLEKGFDARIDNLEVRFNNMEGSFEDSGNSVEGNLRNLGGQNGTRNGAAEERWRKLEIPLFSGDDAYGWVNRVGRYFNLKGVLEQERLQVVMVAMEGRALTWFQWWEFCTVNRTWEDFRTAVIRRFQPSMTQNPYELLLSLKQTTSVEEYREKIELYAGPLKGTDPEYLKRIFLNGLKEAVRAELKLHQLGSLLEMMDYAQKIDEKNRVLNNGSSWNSRGGSASRNYPSSRTVTGKGFKNLTDAEFQEKSRKGLCFRCDEKFGPGHVCKNKQLQVLILEEECIEEEEEESNGGQDGEELEHKVLQLSMYNITGLTSKKSLKMWGERYGKRVTMLVDCGASHNFISSTPVRDKQLPVTETAAYTVEVGDGRKIKCKGVCQQLILQIQKLKIQQDFFIFDLGGVDVVLGREWLAELGDITANFKDLTLKLPTSTGTMVLKGESALSRTEASFRAIVKALRDGGQGFFLECKEILKDSAEENTTAHEIQQFQDLE